MNILITGATGAIGPSVVEALHKTGCKLRIISLEKPAKGLFPPDVETMVGDVTDDAVVCAAMKHMDAVVHMAALLHMVNPSQDLREKYERVNVNGTVTVVDAAIKAGVKRVVLFSTIAVYGPSRGAELTEDSPVKPDTMYAQTKLCAEKIVLAAKCIDGTPLGVVLRLGAVYGSRVKGNYERLLREVSRRRFIPIGEGLNRRTMIYDKDVARAVVLAVSHPAAAGRVFNVTDGVYHTLREIIDSMCFALGRSQPRFSVPIAPVRLLIGLIDRSSRWLGLNLPVQALLDKYTEDIAVDGSLIQQELGFYPEYGLHVGWADTIREMTKNGYALYSNKKDI